MAEKTKKKMSKPVKATVITVVCVALVAFFAVAGFKLLKIYYPTAFVSPKSGVENVTDCTMIAHRGLDCVAPENTLASFQAAADAGYEYVETDIQLTKDGEWVICHDSTINRTTDQKGEIAELTLDEIRSATVDFGSGKKDYPDQKIPTLDEFLDLCAETGLKPVIELKLKGENIDFSKVAQGLEERDMLDDAIIISFYDNELKDFRELCPDITMYYLSNEITQEAVDAALSVGNCGLDVKYKKLTEESVKLARDNGLDIVVWTVDKEASFEKLYDMGITKFTTNSILPE